MKILIPLDGSDASKATLQWAIETLDKTNTRYCLLSVVPQVVGLDVDISYSIEGAQEILREGREILESAGCKVESSEYVLGDAAERICRYADEIGVDQVLMGTHGRTGLLKVFLGSVSEAVLEHCKKPVFVYRNVTRVPAKA